MKLTIATQSISTKRRASPPAEENAFVKKKLIFIFLFFLSLYNRSDAMGLFSKNIMFSEITGIVTLNGKPVEGAEIERLYRWSWDDKEEVDKAITDNGGFFQLKQLEKTPGVSGLVPHEPVIFQKITIRYGGNEYVAWQHTKHNYDNNGELKGKKISLACELTNKPSNDGRVYGICTF